MVETDQIHSLTDFLRNHKSHVDRIKQTGGPEVLTVHGRPELVVLDAGAYQKLMARLEHSEAVAALRADFARLRQIHTADELPPTPDEIARRKRVMDELVAETERLGLYR